MRNLARLMLVGWLAGILAGILAGCGADGDPTPPTKAAGPGFSVSGDIRIGVAGRL